MQESNPNYYQELQQSKIEIPDFSHYFLKGKHLVIAPRVKSWLVLSEIEWSLFLKMRAGLNLEEARKEFKRETDVSDKDLLAESHSLLKQLTSPQFLNSSHTKPQHTAPITNLLAGLTNKCPLHCIHCLTDSGNKLDYEMTLDEWKRVLDEYSEVGDFISFYGGEPLCCDFLFDIAEYARLRGLAPCLFTGGNLINETNASIICKVFQEFN